MKKKYIEYFKKKILRFNYLKEKIPNISNFNNKSSISIYKEFSNLEKIFNKYNKYKNLENNILSTEILLSDKDSDIKKLAQDELIVLKKKKEELESDFKNLFIDKEEKIYNNLFIEIRSATGGDEASIFSKDLFKMYIAFINNLNFKSDLMSFSIGNYGGYKDIVLKVFGSQVSKFLKYESGVHRVQRIPKTESNGRIHTSTCSVCIFPEIESTDIIINNSDIRVDTYRASGAGGQHVNMTDSAVRLTHLPTSITAECQSERSQHKNKQKAMSLLNSRLMLKKKNEEKKKIDNFRKKTIGYGYRSEKIRTYNFSENRVTDHRVSFTTYKLNEILNGNLKIILNKFDDISL